MTPVSPRKLKAIVPVLARIDLECWIVDVLWDQRGEVGTRCSLCNVLLTNCPWALIRYKPVDSKEKGQCLSERAIRCCESCALEYGDNPFKSECNNAGAIAG